MPAGWVKELIAKKRAATGQGDAEMTKAILGGVAVAMEVKLCGGLTRG